MMFPCDHCGMIFFEIYKIPSSAFYLDKKNLVVMDTHINICKPCLLQKEKTT